MNQAAAHSIVQSMAIGSDDTVLEIGPGEGVLTEFLLESPADKIIAVEIDRRVGKWLRVRFDSDKRFKLVEGDILEFDLESVHANDKIRVVGNLPYSITSPILFRMLDNRFRIRDVTVTVQKEVAERLTGKPGTKAYGIPSIFFQLYGNVDLLFHIPRDDFYPVPNVDSSVIHIEFLEGPAFKVDDEIFFRRLIKTIFGQRRKMLRNTLKNLLNGEIETDGISLNLSKRPEELSIEELVMLSNQLKCS